MKKIREDIKKNSFERIYLLYGEERYLVADYKKRLIKASVRKGDTMNYSSYYGESVRWEELLDLSETMPFMAERRVILVEDSGFFKQSSEDREPFVDYIKDIPDTTTFIFVEKEVDKRLKLYKEAEKNGHVSEIKKQRPEDLKTWVIQKLKEDGKNITASAMNEFFDRLGNDMGMIANELEKLICYCMDKEVIEIDDVKNICTRSLEDKVFDMVDCICEFKRDKALALYFDLLQLDVAPEKIMSLIMRHYHILMDIKSFEQSAVPVSEYASRAGVPPFTVKKYRAQTARLSMDRIIDIQGYAVNLVEKVRSGLMDRHIATEMVIFYAAGND